MDMGSRWRMGWKASIVLLLCTILSHGILYSMRSIDKIIIWNEEGQYKKNNNIDTYEWRNSQYTASQLPHWRIATDCSVYNLDCFVVGQRERRYLPYPFPPDSTTEKGSEELWSEETLHTLPDDWTKSLVKATKSTNRIFHRQKVFEENYIYPPIVSEEEYQNCLQFTGVQDEKLNRHNLHQSQHDASSNKPKNTLEQLDELLSTGRITPESDTGMIAFTISDISYVHDMLHDVFQMMDDVVGFSRKHFFLAALDVATVKLACQHGYPVIFWRSIQSDDDESLRDAVANTKIILSAALVDRGIDFFFSEMDVWWIQSPKPSLMDFQRETHHSTNDQNSVVRNNNVNNHIFFSGHQNNPNAPNIGVYAVKANKYTKEYFQVCLDVLKEKPETHDQWAMAEVHRLFQHTLWNITYKFGGPFKPEPPPHAPTVTNPFSARYWSPHEIVADERPMPTQQTLAIHTLNSMPLQMPHGKMMIARELGVYFGFQTKPNAPVSAMTSLLQDQNSIGSDIQKSKSLAGYYQRNGDKYRRYLWLDGPIRTNFYSTAPSERYHDRLTVQWTMAVLIAIARITNRILVLPPIFEADMDAGNYFLWNIMDYSRVNDYVDFRESNFPSNPKSWRMTSESNDKTRWPFTSVATTALMHNSSGVNIYAKVSDKNTIQWQNKLQISSLPALKRFDAFTGMLLNIPEIASAEVLLVYPALIMESRIAHAFGHRLLTFEKARRQNQTGETVGIGIVEEEILEIYSLLRWCWDDGMRHTVSKSSATDSCYGRGGEGA